MQRRDRAEKLLPGGGRDGRERVGIPTPFRRENFLAKTIFALQSCGFLALQTDLLRP